MRLELENAPAVKNPDADAIRASLARLKGFAIFGGDEMTYIQTAGSAREGFVLEYQEGDIDRHYSCPDSLSLEQVVQAFLSYSEGTDSWKTEHQWKQEDI